MKRMEKRRGKHMLLYLPGEEDPIAARYDRYAAMLYRLALSVVKQSEDAEDVVQSVFEKYVRQPHLFLSQEHEKAWMLRVTVNQCKDVLRRSRMRRSVPLEDAAHVGAWDRYSEVTDVLERLPETYRVPLVLYYFEECKVDEIAKALGIGVSAVKMRLKRGRELLKDALEGRETHD